MVEVQKHQTGDKDRDHIHDMKDNRKRHRTRLVNAEQRHADDACPLERAEIAGRDRKHQEHGIDDEYHQRAPDRHVDPEHPDDEYDHERM